MKAFDFSEKIYDSLVATNYSGETDNKKLQAAIIDLAKDYPNEIKLYMRTADDTFIKICSSVMDDNAGDSILVERKAARYLTAEYFTDSAAALDMAVALTNAFLAYKNGHFAYTTYKNDTSHNAEDIIINEQPIASKEYKKNIDPEPLSAVAQAVAEKQSVDRVSQNSVIIHHHADGSMDIDKSSCSANANVSDKTGVHSSNIGSGVIGTFFKLLIIGLIVFSIVYYLNNL